LHCILAISFFLLQAPSAAKRAKSSEEVDGGSVSTSKAATNKPAASATTKGKTDWDSVKWNELGETKDSK